MKAPKQQLNSCTGGTISRLSGREQTPEPFGCLGHLAEWIAPACLPGGVFIRAPRERFMDAHRDLLCGMHAGRVRRGRRGDRVRDSGDRTGLPRPCPEFLSGCSAERPWLRRRSLSDSANAGEPAHAMLNIAVWRGVAPPPSEPPACCAAVRAADARGRLPQDPHRPVGASLSAALHRGLTTARQHRPSHVPPQARVSHDHHLS